MEPDRERMMELGELLGYRAVERKKGKGRVIRGYAGGMNNDDRKLKGGKEKGMQIKKGKYKEIILMWEEVIGERWDVWDIVGEMETTDSVVRRHLREMMEKGLVKMAVEDIGGRRRKVKYYQRNFEIDGEERGGGDEEESDMRCG